MCLIRKILRIVGYYIATANAKIRYRGLIIDGLFRGHKDTQITLQEAGKISIGKRVSFQRNVSLSSVGGTLSVGSEVSFNRNCILVCRKEICIGDRCIFGPNVLIYDHDHQYSKSGVTNKYNTGSVIIEDGCWIGGNVTILRNTHIGEQSVIGAGCVVRGDVPAHSIVTSSRELKIHPIE